MFACLFLYTGWWHKKVCLTMAVNVAVEIHEVTVLVVTVFILASSGRCNYVNNFMVQQTNLPITRET